jgi:hypothetical protein
MKKINTTLKCTSGASLIFVLGIMMFLMSIGVSTMAAAFANAGFIMRQNDFNRVRLLHESIHENIMFSLQDNYENPDSLGYQIAMEIFRTNDPTDPGHIPPLAPGVPAPGLTGDRPLEVWIDGLPIGNFGPRITVDSITLSFPEQFVNIMEAIPYIPLYPSGATGENVITQERLRVPRTATLNASMVVEIVITSGERTITSIAVYEYTGGRLTEYPFVPTYNLASTTMRFVLSAGYAAPGGYGEWNMVRHEIIGW